MTSRVIAKRLGDLPTYGLGYNTGTLLYSENGSNYQIPMTNFLTASKSFDVGFTITSIKEEIVYGSQRLVWTGTYPKTVPSGSTPDTTGGIGSGAWAYSNDSVLRENLRSSEEGLGGDLVSWSRAPMTTKPTTVSEALNTRIVSIWEYADTVVDRPTANDPTTWDWAPAFMAAHAENIQLELIDGETYTIKTPLVYRYTSGTFLNAIRLPFCKGSCLLKYDSLGNGGAGFDTTKQVDDSTQPAYVAAITVYGASGSVVIKQLEGITFVGNNNTAAIKFVGCCGIKPKNNIFNGNRYGIVFNNGTSAGTFTELCVPEFCRWSSGCLVAMAYERGGGDTSFHGCGMGEGCYASASSGSIHPSILIGVGCQPYNAPMNANFWRSGGVFGPVIRNDSGMTAHFHGELKVEHSYGQVLATGSSVIFYGNISMWSGYDKGTLTQVLSGGPTGPSGGNLNFSGITTPTTKRWDIPTIGTTVLIAGYNETSRVMIVGSTWYATFRLSTGRRTTGTVINAPIIVETANCNPITKFKMARSSAGISITTVDASTTVVSFRQGGMPDQSSGTSFTTTEYWGVL